MNEVVIRRAERQDVSFLLEFIRGIARYEKLENEVIASPEVLEREYLTSTGQKQSFPLLMGMKWASHSISSIFQPSSAIQVYTWKTCQLSKS
jgi:hypothetical protein